MLVNNTSLVCCWEQRGRWQQRVVGWPEGVCRDGVPLQREAVGELIADLIFDCDCPGAELVLCLPLEAASWCVVDGYGADGSPGLLPHALQSVDLPFELCRELCHVVAGAGGLGGGGCAAVVDSGLERGC